MRRTPFGACSSAHRASVASRRRACVPRYQRRGCGSAGKRCIGGSAEKTMAGSSKRVRSSVASASSRARHSFWGVRAVTSFTPIAITAASKGCTGMACSRAVRSSIIAPVRATRRHVTGRPSACASRVGNSPESAWACVSTPTPAADESPAINRRKGAAIGAIAAGGLVAQCASPSRAPAASGNLGVVRRTRRPCATSTGASATVAIRWSGTSAELREVRLALLQEGREGFARLRRAQHRAELVAFFGHALRHHGPKP